MADLIKSLWIGESLGALGKLSINSFMRQGHEYHLFCYGDVDDVPAGVVIRDGNEVLPASSIFRYERDPGRGSVAAFANLFRYKVLLEEGGWWADTDVVCLKPFDFPDPVVLASQHEGRGWMVTNGIIKLPAGHAIARDCYELARQRDTRTMMWGDIGPNLINRVVMDHCLTHFVKDIRVFCPLPWWEWALALKEDPGPCLAYLSDEAHAIHLWHEMWRREGIERRTTFPPGALVSRLIERFAGDDAT